LGCKEHDNVKLHHLKQNDIFIYSIHGKDAASLENLVECTLLRLGLIQASTWNTFWSCLLRRDYFELVDRGLHAKRD